MPSRACRGCAGGGAASVRRSALPSRHRAWRGVGGVYHPSPQGHPHGLPVCHPAQQRGVCGLGCCHARQPCACGVYGVQADTPTALHVPGRWAGNNGIALCSFVFLRTAGGAWVMCVAGFVSACVCFPAGLLVQAGPKSLLQQHRVYTSIGSSSCHLMGWVLSSALQQICMRLHCVHIGRVRLAKHLLPVCVASREPEKLRHAVACCAGRCWWAVHGGMGFWFELSTIK